MSLSNHALAAGLTLSLALLASCGGRDAPARAVIEHPPVVRVPFDAREKAVARPGLIRLDDASAHAQVSADPAPAAGFDRVWAFDHDAEGWTFEDGSAPEVRDGRILWKAGPGREGIFSPKLGIPARELRAIEVHMAAANGEHLRLWWSGRKKFKEKLTVVAGIQPGPETLRYLVKTSSLRDWQGMDLDQLRLDPTDGEPAEVEIDSIRLVGREGAYENRGHGTGQESIADEVRNVFFHRAPSEVTWTVALPRGARFDSGAALLQARDGVDLTLSVREAGRETRVLSARLEDDSAWHDFEADLSRWGGHTVTLVAAAASPHAGQIVLWSNPMISGAPQDAPASADRAPNVIVYLMDTLRADHLGAYGHANATSPALDRLAAEGALFENCSSAASWTRPSVASLLTSLPPPSHGCTDHGLAVSDAVVTLAEQMRRAGYVTAGFITSSNAGASANLQQGYDWLRESPSVTGDRRIVEENRKKDFSKKNSALVNHALLPWLDRYGSHPFFLYLHVMDPHAPYEPPAPYDTMFATGYTGLINGSFDEQTGFATARTEAELAHVRSLYDGDIRYNDDRVGELLEALHARGLLDDTLIVVTSDHGEEFREHGGFGHGQSLHGELLHVPLLMRLPGRLPAGTKIAEAMSGLDVMPTILDIAGIEPHPDLQGRSLLPEALPAAAPRTGSPPVVFSWRAGDRGAEEVCAAQGPVKVIYSTAAPLQVFDRSADPGELHDLGPDGASLGADASRIAVRLGEEAKAWLASRQRVTAAGEEARVTIDEEERKWLEALGYVN